MFVYSEREGILKAQERGVQFGAQRKLTQAQITELRSKRAEGVLIRELINEYGLSKSSIYRYLNVDLT